MIEIKQGNVRDYCFIAANMRKADRQEIFCQLPEGTESRIVGVYSHDTSEPRWRFAAFYNGQPVMAYGFQWLNAATLLAWAWGTNDTRRCIPKVGRHILSLREEAIEAGARRIEARSLKTHKTAARWLQKMGASPIADLRQFGRNGETFVLWEWLL